MIEAAGVDVVANLTVGNGGEVIEEPVDATAGVGQGVDAKDVATDRIDRRGRHDVAGVGITSGGIGTGDGAGGAGIEDRQVRAAGGDQLAKVTVAHLRRGDGVDGGNAAPGAEGGVVEEEEGSVFAVVEFGDEEGAADGDAVLVLAEDGFTLVRGSEDVTGVEHVIAVKFEDVAVEIVGAGLGGDGDDASAAAELG